MLKFNCLNCGKENDVKRSNRNKYCNNVCQGEHQFLTKTLPKFMEGKLTDRRTQNKCLAHLHGYKCAECNNPGEHNGRPLSLQTDHIDGNAGNNSPSNLKLLCPNCHSQTDTFGARNKGNGRGSRGLSRR